LSNVNKAAIGFPMPWLKHLMITPENASGDNYKIVDMKKYEFMIYQLITQHVEVDHLFLADSISFRSLSAYLVSDEAWRHKTWLLKKLGNKKLLMPVEQLLDQSDLSYQRMQSQLKNFIRIETLREANDIIRNVIAKLSIFKYWNIHNNRIHGSVDGQKFETRLHSFIARYSSKYFGVNKGVVAYTLCANHIL
jgi:hypothetical protein